MEEYKTFETPETTTKDQLTSDEKDLDSQTFEKYDYIFENIFLYTDLILDSSEEKQLNALKWFSETFDGINYNLSEPILKQLVLLLQSPNPEISHLASKVINWAVSFDSYMHEVLLSNGLIDFLLTSFPEKNTLSICYNLSSTSKESRSILISNGYLDKLKLLHQDETPFKFGHQLHSLVRQPFENLDPKDASMIFGHFQKLWSNLFYHEYKFDRLIASATLSMVQSHIEFLYAFMNMELFHEFMHLPENSDDINDNYVSIVCKIFNYVTNQNIQFAQELIRHNILRFAERVIVKEKLFRASLSAIELVTDLMFHCPEKIEDVYEKHIPHEILDMINDQENCSANMIIHSVSFMIVAMAMASPYIYTKMKAIGCYTLIVENIGVVEDLYGKWAIRVIYKGFSMNKVVENEELRTYLAENESLIQWLQQAVDENVLEYKDQALELLNRIFPERSEIN